MSLSLPRQNSAVGLFVRLFTSLLMSARIKMSAQSGGSEAQSPPPRIINPVHYSMCVCACASEVVFGMKEDNFEV